MDENKDMEKEATITEITQIGNENKDSVIDEQDIYDNNRLETDIQETETETMALNAAFEKPSYFCDNCARYTVFDKTKMDTEDNGDDLDIGIATCAHCGENVLDEIDLEESMTDDMDIFIPEKIVIPMGTFKTTMSGNMFKAIVGNLQCLAEEHKLSISPDKIHVQSADPSHIAMMAMDIPRSATIEYNATTFDLGIDVGKLSDLAKMCKKDTLVDLEIVENRIAYKIGIVSGDMIPVDTAGMSDPRIPNVDLPCHFDVSIKDMLDIMKRASDITDHISITADKDKVIISANGETDNTQMVLTNGKEIQFLEIKDLLTVKSLFALDYLSNIFKALKPCAKTATVFMGTDYPIRIQTNLFAGEGEITYLLAPRIEND